MRALTVQPHVAGTVQVEEIPEPAPAAGELLVEGLMVGVCGTDREIVAGEYGAPPPGDLVVGVVRRPDPVPCGACARGEFDMCRNGRYTERGIKALDGYASLLWTVEPDYAVRLDPGMEDVGVLLEPTSVVAKAWEQVERVGNRSWFEPRRVLVTGAGPIGLLAGLLGTQRGLDVHVADRVGHGAKPDAVAALGATYHTSPISQVAAKLNPDVVIEATGAGSVVFDVIANTAAYGVVCLTGVSSAGRKLAVDAGAANRELVLENDVVIGSVNANLRHYTAAAAALAAADRQWLRRLVTRTVPLEHFADALTAHPDDIKVVITLQ